jgi:hypothetical protein
MASKSKSAKRGSNKLTPTITTSDEPVITEQSPIHTTTKKVILEDITEEEDFSVDIEIKKKFLNIYEFTKLLLERLELDIKGSIKYLCCPNPWGKKYDDSTSYKVVPIFGIYQKKKISYNNMDSLMPNGVVFTVNTTQYRKLTDKCITDGFIIEVSLDEKVSKSGNKYYKYWFTDKFPDSVKPTINEFKEKHYEELNNKYEFKTEADTIEDLDNYEEI